MALNASTMRGVVYSGVPYQVNVTDLPVPTISTGTDAIVRLTHAAICGSDLHMYHGLQGGGTTWGMGHEGIGYIAELGDAVTSLAVGDYVVIPDIVGSGHLDLGPQADFLSYGVLGGLGGLQAEYALIPNADTNLIPVPLTHDTTNSTIEQAYLTLSDIFATGWTAVTWSGFEPGDTIAIFGAGPVGLLAAYAAQLRGAARVYSVDRVPQRLALAASIGAIPVDFSAADPVRQILAREPAGVRRSVDAVGMEALNANGTVEEDVVTRQMIAVTGSQGGIGQIGVYGGVPVPGNVTTAPSPPPPPPEVAPALDPAVPFPLSTFWGKGLSWRSGGVRPLEVAGELVSLIASGKADPSFIGTAEIGLEEAPEYYRRFDRKEEVKVFIRFP